MTDGVYILSVEAKDLFLSNDFKIRDKNGDMIYKKFINTYDYSLELMKTREVYENVYRNKRFSFFHQKKEYTKHVMNVTFKYNVKTFNMIHNRYCVRYPFKLENLIFENGVCVMDGVLAGVDTRFIHEAISIKDECVVEFIQKHVGHHDDKDEYYIKQNFSVVKSTTELREELYDKGFTLDGTQYVRFKRSSGSARVGKCLFIDKKLYPQMHKWESCGISVNKRSRMDLPAWEAYISLTCSSIIDTIDIDPKSILIIDDYDSVFKEDCIAVEYDGEQLVSNRKNVEISNSIWDGQSLLDISMYGDYEEYCMLLLRNRFFKSACFSTNIQEFFKDNNITEIDQLNGYTKADNVSNIKMITTPSSIKYLKFGSADQWLDSIDSTFGIVKHEKPTHYFDGRLVSTHYQLLNTLHLSEKDTEEFLKPTLIYLDYLKNDMDIVKYHINYNFDDRIDNRAARSKTDIVYKMLSLNDKFSQTKIYNDFKKDLVKSFVKYIRTGHVFVRGNYSVLFGNPYEMLLNAVGKFNGTSIIDKGTMHTINFDSGERILGSRSPHVAQGNILLSTNRIKHEINKYFNLTEEIVCINAIGENVLERLSGADYDSDTMLLTNDKILINAAEKHYDDFLVPTRLIEAKKAPKKYTPQDQATLDIKTSVNKIGEIINLSQDLNSMIWDAINNGASIYDVEDIYCDVAMLDVMSNLEIDMAKKEFTVNNGRELRKLKDKYKRVDRRGRRVKSNFFQYVERRKGYYDNKSKNYLFHDTTMDYLQRVVNKHHRTRGPQKEFIDFTDIFDLSGFDIKKVKYDTVNDVINEVKTCKCNIKQIWARTTLSEREKRILSFNQKQECINFVDNIDMSQHTMHYLLMQLEKKRNEDIRKMLFEILFGAPNKSFFCFLKSQQEDMYELVEVISGGEYNFFGMFFAKSLQKRRFSVEMEDSKMYDIVEI